MQLQDTPQQFHVRILSINCWQSLIYPTYQVYTLKNDRKNKSILHSCSGFSYVVYTKMSLNTELLMV